MTGTDGPSASVRLRDQRTIRRLVLNPSLGAGEAYMCGRLTAEDGGIYDFLDTMLVNLQASRADIRSSACASIGRRRPPANAVQSGRAGARATWRITTI